MRNYLNFLKMKWSIFTYNFAWSDYVFLFEGWLAKSAMAIPFVGYLILFNDSVAQHLEFDKLTREATSTFGLSSNARLKFVYLGLVSIGLASIIYYLRRPYALKIGRNEFEYVERALVHFSIANYISIHDEIRHCGLDPYTQHGKYYDSDFEGFLKAATGTATWTGVNKSQDFHWAEAKAKYESLLRSLLIENFFRSKIKRRKSLTLCLTLSLVGYSLLAIPSADLFAKVMLVIFRSLT